MNKALFLDRDGVINKEVNYLYRIKDLDIFPNITPVLKNAKEAGYLIILITNQAGIARGYYAENDYNILMEHINNYFKKEGVEISKSYFCPHHPEGRGSYGIDCNCRKPKIGMIRQSQKDFGGIDLSKSILVGDKETDIQAGVNAGIGRLILVESGHEIDKEKTKATEIITGLWELKI